MEELESYLARLQDYSEEQIENVRKIRTEWEMMTFEQFNFLYDQKVVERTVKLKTPRHLFVSPEGGIYYLNHYHKWYNKIGQFKNN